MRETTFEPLREELAIWEAHGLVSRWWWRDDDVTDASALLTPLRRLADRSAVPVLMAAIPALMSESLAVETQNDANLSWCQHGYAHRNHATPPEDKSEFPDHRSLETCLDDLREGRARLRSCFGDRLLDVLVPPWNHLGYNIEGKLGALGFVGVSRYGRARRGSTGGITRVDTHVDVVDWTSVPEPGESWFGGVTLRLTKQLAMRRMQPQTALEPIGVLTHHRAMGPYAWDFMEQLIRVLTRSCSARWVLARDLFRDSVGASNQASP